MGEKKPDHQVGLIIIYNGVERPISVPPKESVQALLEQSMNAFAVHQNRHLMALWTEAGVELQLSDSVESAGLTQGSRLLLRPSAVRGG